MLFIRNLASIGPDPVRNPPHHCLTRFRWKLFFLKQRNWPGFQRGIDWSTGRELNPRILVLQTSALATSPPVLILLPQRELFQSSSRKSFHAMKNPPRSYRGWGACVSIRCSLSNPSPSTRPHIALATAATGTSRNGLKLDHRNSSHDALEACKPRRISVD